MPIDDKKKFYYDCPPFPWQQNLTQNRLQLSMYKRSPRSFRLIGVFEFEYDINPDIILKRPERTVIIEQQILM